MQDCDLLLYCRVDYYQRPDLMKSTKKIDQLYGRSDALYLELSAYFKKLMHDHQKGSTYTVEQKKILKLFSYNVWEQYIRWVEQKLQEGESNTQVRNLLPQILEEQAELEDSIYTEVNYGKMVRCELLAIENAKLRKQNMGLSDKIEKLEHELQTGYGYYRNNAH